MAILKGSRPLPQQPKIDLPGAHLQVLAVVVHEEPIEKEKKDGEKFTIDPHFQIKLVVLSDCDHEGATFHDRFALKEEGGVWTVRGGGKLGALFCLAHNDPDLFNRDDIEVDSNDLIDLEFIADVKPGKNYGSYVEYESIKAVGGDG